MTQKIISDLYDEDTREDPIVELLNSTGLKSSKPRLRLMTEMYEAGKPLSIHDLQKKVPEIDSSSVYRTLNSLVESNIVRTVHTGTTEIYYELVLEKNHHHHIICTKCRDIEDIDTCIEDKMENDVLANSKNFSNLTHHSLEFYGLCKTCTKKS